LPIEHADLSLLGNREENQDRVAIAIDDGAAFLAVVDGMGGVLADRLSRYKHPESFEIVSVGPRDDSGKVRRTLLRDERTAWLKEGRAFQLLPSRQQAERA